MTIDWKWFIQILINYVINDYNYINYNYNELNWMCMKFSLLVLATQCFIIHFNNIIYYLYGMSTVVVHFGHEMAHLTKVKMDVSAQFCWLFSSRKFSESQDFWTPHEFTLPLRAWSIDQSYNNERKNICASRSGDQWDTMNPISTPHLITIELRIL